MCLLKKIRLPYKTKSLKKRLIKNYIFIIKNTKYVINKWMTIVTNNKIQYKLYFIITLIKVLTSNNIQ